MSIPSRHSVLCAGDTHVFQVGSTACDCGLWAATQPANPYPLYYPHGYNPFSPPKPNTPPPGEAPPVNIRVFRAAKNAGASHLSSDGLRIYCERFGATLEAEWDGERWGSWWSIDGLPADAVKM